MTFEWDQKKKILRPKPVKYMVALWLNFKLKHIAIYSSYKCVTVWPDFSLDESFLKKIPIKKNHQKNFYHEKIFFLNEINAQNVFLYPLFYFLINVVFFFCLGFFKMLFTTYFFQWNCLQKRHKKNKSVTIK